MVGPGSRHYDWNSYHFFPDVHDVDIEVLRKGRARQTYKSYAGHSVNLDWLDIRDNVMYDRATTSHHRRSICTVILFLRLLAYFTFSLNSFCFLHWLYFFVSFPSQKVSLQFSFDFKPKSENSKNPQHSLQCPRMPIPGKIILERIGPYFC